MVTSVVIQQKNCQVYVLEVYSHNFSPALYIQRNVDRIVI